MQELGTISTAFSSLVTLSVATERLVELIKNMIPSLNEQNSDPTKECWRNIALRLLAVVAGIFSAWLAHTQLDGFVGTLWSSWGGIVILGLFASGGSGFWSASLKLVSALKDEKKVEMEKKQQPVPAPPLTVAA